MKNAASIRHVIKNKPGFSSHVQPAAWQMPKLVQKLTPRRAFVRKHKSALG